MHGNNASICPVAPPAQRQQQDPAPNSSQPAPTSASSSSPTSTSPAIMPASITAQCQHPGCSKPAKYGLRDPREEPPIACQSHKRAGQLTVNRRGELLKATRDGEAFRVPAVVPTLVPPSPPADSETAGTAETVVQNQQQSTGSSASFSAPSRPKSLTKLSPAPAQTPKLKLKRANRPRLPSEDEGSPASQKTSCLFPGCDARPAYGLPGAVRAVYCFSHKKGAMVLVSEDALDTPQIEGKKTPVAPAAVESEELKARPPPTAADRKEAKKARRTPKEEREGGGRADGRGSEQGVKNGGDGKAAGRAAVAKKSVTPAAVSGSRSKMGPSSSSPSAAATPTTPENDEGETAATAVQARPPNPPSASTKGLASGMSPSGEFLVLKQAREAAKKEAEASGGGRRPRAPSRRALEASGRMKDEGAQWMTREKKAEEARAQKELREQRRQYKAAGLSVGVVVEAYVANGTAAAMETGNGAVGSGGSGAGGVGGLTLAHDESGWRKVSPALLTALPSPPKKKEGKVAPVAGEMPGKVAWSTAAANIA